MSRHPEGVPKLVYRMTVEAAKKASGTPNQLARLKVKYAQTMSLITRIEITKCKKNHAPATNSWQAALEVEHLQYREMSKIIDLRIIQLTSGKDASMMELGKYDALMAIYHWREV